MTSAHKVRIAARLRPKIQGEVNDDLVQVHRSEDGTSTSCITVVNPRDTTQVFKFPFSSCYNQESTQQQIFETDVKPLLDVVYSGVTVTIFAYGVTSSGKTHTMQGTTAEPGVIPQVVQALFDRVPGYSRYEITFSVSYMEIYKDEVYDLLVTRENAPKLPVRENDAGMVFVANLTSLPIASVEEFGTIYSRASKHRSVGATNLNRASSRSHAVLTIEVAMLDPTDNKTLTGKINLVDLAGSENNKLTGNDPSRMAESAAINKSLSVLGQVVHALNQGASRIPYRNSKLTRILQDALGGSSVGLLICNIAPGVKFRQDTLNTLNFAVRTKNVENKPVVNERDNRPQPKPHFAAVTVQPPPLKAATAIMQAAATAGKPTAVPARGRPSLVPVSRMPRASAIGTVNGYQPFAVNGNNGSLNKRGGSRLPGEKVDESDNSGSVGFMLTEKEIDERISKIVEAEVARRLEERLKEKERDEEERRKKEEAQRLEASSSSLTRSPSKRDQDRSLPSGILTPLLMKHRDLDNELRSRLKELERKLEHGHKEFQLADVLSPTSRKKTGRAYVALARAHSEKGDLQVALDLYRKAETYVPNNVKLKERIIEIEWAVKNDTAFVPSPKPRKKQRTRSKRTKTRTVAHESDAEDEGAAVSRMEGEGEGEQVGKSKGGKHRKGESDFGFEITNVDGGGSNSTNAKRPHSPCKKGGAADAEGDGDGDEETVETPPKKQKRGAVKLVKVVESSDEGEDSEWVPRLAAKSKRKLAV
ncbi:hypothetical protein AX17_007517 [Amanita inopinata Kibby_2008]|nr:hypothetical protein AX17_007517 [Amanita inopinata Kibby_2008]